jgi:hypothetical protein
MLHTPNVLLLNVAFSVSTTVATCSNNQHVAFHLLPREEKDTRILRWIAPNHVSGLITVKDIVKSLPLQLLDKLVQEEIKVLKGHFDRASYVYLLSQLKCLEQDADFLCEACGVTLRAHCEAISCDCCLLWYHMKCAQGNTALTSWFCPECL